jgi:hypothetical protein
MAFSVGPVRGARLGFHDADIDANAIMPLFRAKQDKNLQLHVGELTCGLAMWVNIEQRQNVGA